MSPTLPLQYPMHLGARYSKFNSQGCFRIGTMTERPTIPLLASLHISRIFAPYLSNVLLCYFGHPISFAKSPASFFNFVLNVIIVCTCKQMSRVNASGVIALVAYYFAFRDSALMDLPRQPMGANLPPPIRKKAIPIPIYKALPVPAPASLFNESPKSYFFGSLGISHTEEYAIRGTVFQ